MKIELLPILSDNYAYKLTSDNGCVAVLDPGVFVDVGERCDYVLNTHHHWDHTDGNAEMIERYGAELIAPDNVGDVFDFDGHEAQIIRTAGHTMDGISYYFAAANDGAGAVFTGDTLFSMGCGRLFEGTPADMWASFEKLMALPDETLVYCGHEYTRANAGFCLKIEPDNVTLRERIAEVKKLRAEGKPSIPTSIGLEKATNVFLRAGNAERFAELRALKDKG